MSVPPVTRRQAIVRGAAAGGALLLAGGPLRLLGAPEAAAAAGGAGWSAQDYWRFIDGIVERLEDRWLPDQDAYAPVSETYAAVNAHMLMIHAVAAAAACTTGRSARGSRAGRSSPRGIWNRSSRGRRRPEVVSRVGAERAPGRAVVTCASERPADPQVGVK